MIRYWLFAALVLLVLPAAVAGQEFRALMEVAPDQPDAVAPYRRAVLTLHNAGDAPVGAIGLRAGEGGPSLLYPVTLAPLGRATLTVELPAAGSNQQWQLTAYDRYDRGRGDTPGPRRLHHATAEIRWPAELVTTDQLLDRDAMEALVVLPDWPDTLRYQALAVPAGMLVLAGFALLLRRPWMRPAALLLTVTAAMGALAWAAKTVAPPTIERQHYRLVRRDMDGPTRGERLLVLTARRTVQGQAELPAPRVVYPDRHSMRTDRTLLRPLEPGFSGGVPVEFHLSPRQGLLLVSRDPPPAGQPPPAQVQLAFDPADGAAYLRASRALPPGVLVFDGRALPVPALAAGVRRRIDAHAHRPVRHVRADPQAFGLDERSLVLFEWWYRNTHWGGSPTYLIHPVDDPEAVQLHVIEADFGDFRMDLG